MSVRAKFKVSTITRMQGSRRNDDGKYVPCEMQSIKLNAVYGGDDASHENRKFWDATPSGELTLNVIHADAGNYFELSEEYYLEFTKALKPS